MAGHLVAIAKYHVRVDDKELEQLRTLKARLVVESPGLTEKNKARLAQFEDTRNVDRLLALPVHLLGRAKISKRASSRVALGVMYAVAIELLLACPIRVGNLARLNIETHFRWYGQGRSQRLAMVIPGSEVKNKEPIEVDLPQESMRLVKTYLADWRPLVSDAPGDWLFPARGGGHRLPSHLSQEMSRVIFKHTGLLVNAHLFRHLAGMLYLIENPGEYETVRRLLGHRKMTTTTTFYAPLENKQAVKRYDEVVLSKRRRT
jgi:integrase